MGLLINQKRPDANPERYWNAAHDVLSSNKLKPTGELFTPTHGIVNHVFSVDTDRDRVFMKLSEGRTCLRRHVQEVRALRLLQEIDHPAPLILDAGVLREHDLSYVLVTGVSGYNLQEALENFQIDSQGMYHGLGSALVGLHSQTASIVDFEEMQAAHIRSVSDTMRKLDVYLRSDSYAGELDRFLPIVTNCHAIMLTAGEFCLVHGDAKADNGILSKDQTVLIDWEFSKYSVPEYDLARLAIIYSEHQGAIDAIMEAYGSEHEIDWELFNACKVILTLRVYENNIKEMGPQKSLRSFELFKDAVGDFLSQE